MRGDEKLYHHSKKTHQCVLSWIEPQNKVEWNINDDDGGNNGQNLHGVHGVWLCVRVTSFIICFSMQWQWWWRCVAIVCALGFSFLSTSSTAIELNIQPGSPKMAVESPYFAFIHSKIHTFFRSLLMTNFKYLCTVFWCLFHFGMTKAILFFLKSHHTHYQLFRRI